MEQWWRVGTGTRTGAWRKLWLVSQTGNRALGYCYIWVEEHGDDQHEGRLRPLATAVTDTYMAVGFLFIVVSFS